jgi:hypothetical protein
LKKKCFNFATKYNDIFVLKILAIILSFYILTLTLLPCVDSHSDSCQNDSLCTQQDKAPNHSDADSCSPFCTCHCCGTSPTISLKVVFIGLITPPNVIEFFYQVEKVSEIALTFWQPPKV